MFFFFQAEDGIRDRSPSRGLGDVYKRQAKSSTDAALEAMHTGMYALLRWRMYRIPFSEFLEQLASDNGADMHKYNTLYTRIF